MQEAYPLSWPPHRPRTSYRQQSRFKVQSFARVRDELLNELKLLGAKGLVLSSNLKLRQDGLPMANQAQPKDTGVAVYFTYKGKQVCFACDRWRRIEDNMQAVNHTINALRGIARWGTGDMVDAAFSGFKALPNEATVTAPPWHLTLGVPSTADADAVRDAYRGLALKYHPDRNPEGGEKMQQINAAYEDFKRVRGMS
jgi:hypothetical protein